ncbi:MAG TPA: tetratricopeptide repeat protein [Thermoanaerobaculia bacterium]|nr:tetratricopeptide repeat protein [Thermoanaerobaculia bacterium]
MLLFLALACARHEAPKTEPRANDIILITIDTWRADAAGFAGNANAKTPFLDSLAARGIVFTNAHAHNVVTLPSHVNILTGLLPYQHGVRDNAGFVLDAKYPTVAATLREHGYATGAFVAAFPLDARFGLNRGFDVYDDNYGKGAATVEFVMQERDAPAVLDSATKWWRSVEGHKRFLWIHLYDPHAPYRSGSYWSEVALVDDALRTTLAPILTRDTTVIITGDHGEALGDHGELTHGLFAYESTLKVPLLVVAPGVAPRRESAAVRHIDIAPTILASAGIASTLPGKSLLGTIGARDTYFEALSASLNRGWAPLTGVIHSDLKYIDLPLAEFYALPDEIKNLRDERRRDVDAARQLLPKLVVANREISVEEAARLRSLGYVTGASASKSYGPADDPKTLIDIDTKIHRIIEAYETRDLRKAVTLAREVVAAKPDMRAGRELLAFVLQQSDRVDEAIAVLRDKDATEDMKLQLALLLTETGRASEAVQILAPLANGSNPDVLNGYGIALADEGKADEAIQQFNRVLATDANNAPALQNLGIVALRRDDVRSARDYLDRALALNPRLPLALNTLGVVAAREGDYPRALDLWQRAVSIDPRQYDALYNLGLVAARSGNRDLARRALEQFVATAPPSYKADIAAAREALARM